MSFTKFFVLELSSRSSSFRLVVPKSIGSVYESFFFSIFFMLKSVDLPKERSAGLSARISNLERN